jgi:hypothetical protein
MIEKMKKNKSLSKKLEAVTSLVLAILIASGIVAASVFGDDSGKRID